MEKVVEDLQREWSDSSISWTGLRLLVTNEVKCPKLIIHIDTLVRDIAKSRHDLFTVKDGQGGKRVVQMNALAKRLVDGIFALDPALAREHLPLHTFSPTFELWERYRKDHPFITRGYVTPEIALLANHWITSMRSEAKEEAFMKTIHDSERSARMNLASARGYVDGLFDRHAKLLVIRIDLGYRHDPSESWRPQMPGSVMKGHVKEMIRFLRRDIPGLVGYCWKKEYGALKGPHVHLLVFLNGHEVWEDITWGHVVGKFWESLTQHEGVYWLCNADKQGYRKRGTLGIGMLGYTDQALRARLDEVLVYLTKADYYARYIDPDAGRIFGKGVLKHNKAKPGPPRQLATL